MYSKQRPSSGEISGMVFGMLGRTNAWRVSALRPSITVSSAVISAFRPSLAVIRVVMSALRPSIALTRFAISGPRPPTAIAIAVLMSCSKPKSLKRPLSLFGIGHSNDTGASEAGCQRTPSAAE
jgi:hypothetical protein